MHLVRTVIIKAPLKRGTNKKETIMETTKLTVKLTHRPTIHIGKMGYTSVNGIKAPLVTLCGHPKDLSLVGDGRHIQEWESAIGNTHTCKKCEQSLNKIMNRWFVEGDGDSFSYFLNKELEARRGRVKIKKYSKPAGPVKKPVIGIDRRIGPNEYHHACIGILNIDASNTHLSALSPKGYITPFCGKDLACRDVSYEENPRITCPECVEMFRKFNINENTPKRDRTLEQRRGMIKAEVTHLANFLENNRSLINEVCKHTDFQGVVSEEFYNTLAELPAAITRVKHLIGGIKFKKFKEDLGLEKELATISYFWG
jgi:hypothetical protein